MAAWSVVLKMLEDKDSWLERLVDGSPKVEWMRRVYLRVDYTQGPWTVVPRQPSQSIHTLREAYIRRRFRIPYLFSWSSSSCW